MSIDKVSELEHEIRGWRVDTFADPGLDRLSQTY